MRNPFKPQPMPQNPTPGNPDGTSGTLRDAVAKPKEKKAVGREPGESFRDTRRRANTGIDKKGRAR